MAARALWKGVLCLGEARVPVQFFAALNDRNLHFHLLHKPDRARVRQQMINSVTGEPVPLDRARKGYEIERGTYVGLDESELESLQPAPSREIHVAAFVPSDRIQHPWYLRPYWLGPDGQDTHYFSLAAVMAARRMEAIVQWVMRGKAYVGALQPFKNYLMVITLRHRQEIVADSRLEPPAGRDLLSSERDLARQLIASLESKFDHSQYRDAYRERVLKMIAAKRRGKRIPIRKPAPPPRAKSLTESLRASLARAKN